MTLRQIEDRALRLSIEGKEEEAEALYAFVSSILPGSFSHARDSASLNRPVAEAALPRQAAAAYSPGTGQPPRRASRPLERAVRDVAMILALSRSLQERFRPLVGRGVTAQTTDKPVKVLRLPDKGPGRCV
ncbi:hypothetical protein [Novosphingobium sp. THN1]|uniref:hypothetical protein n=1 Tax=Novosphingobium sp. THN1 TaxID=1016987 RepID=UPI0013C304DF|nr:hypothetical protein [Novosphingobium sp. THN1]